MNVNLDENSNIAIIGLGLIGGSIAKAIKENTNCTVYGCDIQNTVVKKAVLIGAIDSMLTEELLPKCHMVIIALYPHETVKYIKTHASEFMKNSVVLDCCGVKEIVCRDAEPIAKDNGFIFMGGHPMAGVEHSGFGHSKKALFNNASMILTPALGTPIALVDSVKKLFLKLGFTNTEITTPKEHDQRIAFTSQLAHVVSSAYVKSPSAAYHKGFSAGSYKDLTRVAKLNEDMWAELFLSNVDALSFEIDSIIHKLTEYKTSIENKDFEGLRDLLKDGKEKKMLIDGERF